LPFAKVVVKSNLGSISRAGGDAPLGRVNPQHLTLKRAAARGCSVPLPDIVAHVIIFVLRRQSTVAEEAMDLLVNIDVDDLSKAIAFYQQAAGLRLGRRFGSLGVEMLGTSSAIYLLVKPEGTRPSTSTDEVRRYQRHWTPVHLDFVVSELEAAVSSAIEAGATIDGEIQTHNWGRIAHMADPFGHGICFIQFLGRGYDEISHK
jgi:predicted enzyme related to lactoylglutathione lyase